MNNKITNASFRQIMGCFATGIAVVTAQNDRLGPFGITINSISSVSLDPPLLLFCLDKKAHLHEAFSEADYFAANFLAADQERVSRHFADRNHNPAPPDMWDGQRQGCPLLGGTLGWVLCRTHARYEGGDHTIFLGEVIDLFRIDEAVEKSRDPLLYFGGRYRAVAPLSDGNVTSGARK